MGFILWGLLTVLAITAGISLALRVGSKLTIGEQVVGALLTAIAFIVGSAQALGYASVLYPWTLGSAVAVESVATLVLARVPGSAWQAFGRRLSGAARRSISFGSIVVMIPVAALVLYLAAYVWLLPSWCWDAVWYHNPIAAFAFQDHSLRWHQVSDDARWTNSYPKNIELLGLWNVMFAPDDRLIDGVQLPVSLIGVVSLAALCRRAGASAAVAWPLGLTWLLFPAVFLNIPSSYVDVSCASLWLAAVLFLARMDASSEHRFFGAIALGLYFGGKVTGGEHSAFIAPLVAFVLVRQWRAGAISGRRIFGDLGAMATAILLLGGATYLRNTIAYQNPVWPVKFSLFGYELPGVVAMKSLNTPPWKGPDNLAAMWRSFTYPNPTWIVDVRVGGFGPLWVYVLLPLCGVALVGALVRAIRRRQVTPGALAIVVLLVTAVLTPARWWCRYTLGFPAGGLLSAGVVLGWLPRGWMRQIVLAGMAVFAVVQGWPALEGFHAPLDLLKTAAAESPRDRDAIKIGNWQEPWISLREDVLDPGDAAIYDGSVAFPYLLWRFDWRNRVLFRPCKDKTCEDWRKGIEAEGARWASVKRGSPAENALSDGGWTFLSRCNVQKCNVWIRPRNPIAIPSNITPRSTPAPRPVAPVTAPLRRLPQSG